MLTRILIAINVIVYGWESVTGSDAFETRWALLGTDVLNGQWWRIFTGAFLHGGLTHILFNMIALWQVGRVVEIIYGTARMGAIYALATLGSGLLVTFWDPNDVTVGASGAIFGLFGALLVGGMRLGAAGRDLVRQCTGIIVLNLVISFWPGSHISYTAHIGGLIAGFLSGLVLFRHRLQAQPQPQPQPYKQPAYAPARVDLRNDPGVVTIEQPLEEPAEHDPHGEPRR